MNPILILIAVLLAADILIQGVRAFTESRNSSRLEKLIASLDTEETGEMPMSLAWLVRISKTTRDRLEKLEQGQVNIDRWFNHLKGEIGLIPGKLRVEILAQMTDDIEAAMAIENEKLAAAKKTKRTKKAEKFGPR